MRSLPYVTAPALRPLVVAVRRALAAMQAEATRAHMAQQQQAVALAELRRAHFDLKTLAAATAEQAKRVLRM